MSAQDTMEKVLRELHVLLSKSNPYERDSNYLVVNKKEMLDVLKQLAVCMSEVMDCLLYTSPSPRDIAISRMPSSA